MTIAARTTTSTGRRPPRRCVLGSSLGATRACGTPSRGAGRPVAGGALRPPGARHVAGAAGPGHARRTSAGRRARTLADRLELQRFSYAGLSLGGMVGMWLAAHAPERVRPAGPAVHLGAACRRRRCGTSGRPRCGRPAPVPRSRTSVVARWFTPDFAAAAPGRRRRVHRPCWTTSTPRATPPAARRSPPWTCAPTWAGSPPRRW